MIGRLYCWKIRISTLLFILWAPERTDTPTVRPVAYINLPCAIRLGCWPTPWASPAWSEWSTPPVPPLSRQAMLPASVTIFQLFKTKYSAAKNTFSGFYLRTLPYIFLLRSRTQPSARPFLYKWNSGKFGHLATSVLVVLGKRGSCCHSARQLPSLALG